MPVEYSPFSTDDRRREAIALPTGWRVPCCGVLGGAPKAMPLARGAPLCPPTAGRLAIL